MVQRDFAIDLLNRILSPDKLRIAYELANRRLAEPNDDRSYRERFFAIAGLSEFVISNIERAKDVMRTDDFYDMRCYRWASSIIKMGCELASLPYYPAVYTPCEYRTGRKLTYGSLKEMVLDSRDNLFRRPFLEELTPLIDLEDPDLIGISVTYGDQIVPAFLLAWLIRTTAPGIHICMGGPMISSMAEYILREPRMFEFADSYVVGEGETALLGLTNAIRAGQALCDIPNVIFREEERVQHGPLWRIEDAADLTFPDYAGLDLSSYLSPEPVLLLSSSRGCYYGKCAFCNVSMHTKGRYRKMQKGKLASALRTYQDEIGARRFFFCDDAFPKGSMDEVVKLVKTERHDITWAAEARFEKNLTAEYVQALAEGGCRQLVFGLESTSQRVLDLMNKDNSPERDLEIIMRCHDSGIQVNIQSFIGFPTESEDEAKGTVEFLKENEDMIASIGFGTFGLYEDTPVFNEPERFELRNVRRRGADAMIPLYDFDRLSGMSEQRLKETYRSSTEVLSKIYDSRMEYLGCPTGAHPLLHFTKYNPEQMSKRWKKTDKPRGKIDPSLPRETFIKASEILLSSETRKAHEFPHIALHTVTGKRYRLTYEEQRMLELFDKGKAVEKAVAEWIDEREPSNEDATHVTLRAYLIVKEFIEKGLLVAVG
ncbi:MAG TPA: radical SAM protein [Methanomassiliicoccales archaeon]|nr:radical SAM protein [Methanomassiliicoccales archaeon]